MQAVRLCIMNVESCKNRTSGSSLGCACWPRLSRQTPSRVPTLSSALIFGEMIKMLTCRTWGWISHLTSAEQPCHVRHRIQQPSRAIIFALNAFICRKKQLSTECCLYFCFRAREFWLYLNGTLDNIHFVPHTFHKRLVMEERSMRKECNGATLCTKTLSRSM